jgi:acyl-CoA synthetase (AMP-forming)/AMP-acid ligase II/acyl carrier protein
LKLFRIAEKLHQPGLFTDSQTSARLQDFADKNDLQSAYAALHERTIPCDQAAADTHEGMVHQPQESDTAFIQFSSGSTSTPKGVVLTHRNLLTNLRAIVKGSAMTSSEHQLSWMPLTHDMGLIGYHLNPVFMDNDHSLMPTDVFVRRPSVWLTEAAALGATVLCSPNFGYQHLLKSFKPEKHDGLDLSSVRLIFNGAEPISVPLCRRFMQALAPFGLSQSAMYPVYGLAEASLAVAFPSLDRPFMTIRIDRTQLGIGQPVRILDDTLDAGVEFVAVGKPVDHVELQISDAAGQAMPADTTGHIRIRGDNVTAGYFEEPELNRETIDENGWLDTGDLGFVHDGQLFITGRSKDIIFVNGQNVYPHDLEEIILQADLFERGKLAVASQRLQDTGEERLLVFLLHRADPSDLDDLARAITRVLSEQAGVAVHAVVPVPRIPKTTSGKVQRYLLVEGVEQGEFEPLLQATGGEGTELPDAAPDGAGSAEQKPDTATRLLAICNAEVKDMPVAMGDNLFELGISSLTLAQIHAAIEDTWPDQVDITDLFDYPTVAELARFLDERNAA